KERAAAQSFAEVFCDKQFLRFTPGRGEVQVNGFILRVADLDLGQFADKAMRFINAILRFGGARLWASPQPLHFPLDLALQRMLALALGRQKVFLAYQKVAVVAL